MSWPVSRIACALGAAFLVGCGSAAPPNIVLIVIDTLRADHLGAYGYARPTSPNLDRLATEGRLFTDAVAPSSWTKPSVASLFTSLLPSEHGAVSFEGTLPAGVPTLAERLSQAGYSTYAVSGNFVHINKRNGFARGFTGFRVLTYRTDSASDDPILRDDTPGREKASLRAPRAGEVNQAALAHVRSAPPGPVFLYLHYMEPHAGYVPIPHFRKQFSPDVSAEEPPFTSAVLWDLTKHAEPLPEAARKRMIDAYDAEIAAVDAGIGRLIDKLEATGFLDNAVLFVVSDHGEEFYEHGNWQHGLALHRESIAVPLIVRDWRRGAQTGKDATPVDLLDVGPTILRLAGTPAPEGGRGRDLLSALVRRHRISELHPDPVFEGEARPRIHRLALLTDSSTSILLRSGEVERYRRAEDPEERSPADAGGDADAVRELAATLDRVAAEGERRALDAGDLESLRALGYVE